MSFLEIKNISKSYKMKESSLLVIDDFSYEAEKGDLISLTGPSGGGKSALPDPAGGKGPGQGHCHGLCQ